MIFVKVSNPDTAFNIEIVSCDFIHITLLSSVLIQLSLSVL